MEIFKAGTIERPQGTNYINLLFQDVKSIQNIAVLLNGKMRTPKIYTLHALIDWLNRAQDSGSSIKKLSLNTEPLESNP